MFLCNKYGNKKVCFCVYTCSGEWKFNVYLHVCEWECVCVHLRERKRMCVCWWLCVGEWVSTFRRETTALHLYVSQWECVCTFGKRLGYTCIHVHVCVHIWERKKPWLLGEREADLQCVCVCVHAWHRKLHHMCMCVRESVCVYTLWQRTPDVYIYVCVSQGLCITVIDRFFIQHYSLDQTHCTRVACDSEWETVSFL